MKLYMIVGWDDSSTIEDVNWYFGDNRFDYEAQLYQYEDYFAHVKTWEGSTKNYKKSDLWFHTVKGFDK